jgi:stage II sporulation protein D
MKKYKIILILLFLILFTLFTLLLTKKHQEEPKEKLPQLEIKLYLKEDDQVIKLSLEEYLVGTVAAEMPASFGMEALKAQAVCARTYALRKMMSHQKYPFPTHLRHFQFGLRK